MSKLAIQMSKRVKEKFNLDLIPKIHRTYAGYWQKAEGAFSWFMLTKDNKCVGSAYSAKEVSEADDLDILWADVTQAEIFPARDKKGER